MNCSCSNCGNGYSSVIPYCPVCGEATPRLNNADGKKLVGLHLKRKQFEGLLEALNNLKDIHGNEDSGGII